MLPLIVLLTVAQPGEAPPGEAPPALPGSFVRTLHHDVPRHEGKAICVAYSPDGKMLASGGWDRRIRLWDAVTHRPIRDWQAHDPAVWPLVFRNDGKQILSAGRDGKVILWDISGREIRRFEGHTAGVYKLAWLQAEGRILTTSFDKTLREWDAATGKQLRQITQEQEVHALAVAPDGKSLATGTDQGRITLYRRDLTELSSWQGHGTGIDHLAYSPDGKLLVSAGWDQTAIIWNPADGAKLRTLEGHRDNVWPVVFTADGKRLLSADRAGMIRVWDPLQGKLLRAIDGPSQGVPMLALRPDGKVFATASWDGTIQQWELDTGRLLTDLPGHSERILALRLSADGRECLSLATDGRLLAWNTQGGPPRRLGQARLEALRFGLLGQKGALVANEPGQALWMPFDKSEGELAVTVPRDPVGLALFAQDAQLLGLSREGMLSQRRLSAEAMPQETALDPAQTCLLTPDEQHLILANPTQGIVWYRRSDGRRGRTVAVTPEQVPTALCMSPDGRLLVGTSSRRICVWEAASGLLRCEFNAPGAPARPVAFLPGGRWLIVAEQNGRWQALDLLRGVVALQREGPAGEPTAMALSADGRTMAIGQKSGLVHLWNLAAETLPSLPAPGNLTEGQLRGHLKNLPSEDAARMRVAMLALLEGGPTTVALLRAEIAPEPRSDPADVARWIAQLDAEEFEERDRARKALVRHGTCIEPDLERALQKTRSLEQRRLLQMAQEEILAGRPEPMTLARLRAVEILERLRAVEVLETLSQGDPEAEVTRQARAARARLRNAP